MRKLQLTLVVLFFITPCVSVFMYAYAKLGFGDEALAAYEKMKGKSDE